MLVKEPKLWNPEQPYLYTLVLETEGEVITDRIGIREIVVKDAVLYVNGTAINIKGVNRHDSDPVTGFVIGLEQMKKDLQMMKRITSMQSVAAIIPMHLIFISFVMNMDFL